MRWLIVVVAGASMLAAGCIANADEDAATDEEAPPAAAVQAATEPAASEPQRAAATTTARDVGVNRDAQTAQASELQTPSTGVRQIAASTSRKDLNGDPSAELGGPALAKAFYRFADFATLELSPELVVAWGIGAPRGGYVITASVWQSSDDGAAELSSTELLSGGSLRSADAVRAVDTASANRAWLEAFGVAGAHGVTYDLLLWDGASLRAVVGHFTSAPGNVVAAGAAAELRDLNGDGQLELVIDRTDPYLFYYTSQIWHADAAVLRRDGDEFREVTLALPSASVGEPALASARSAIAFAEAGWWGFALEHAEAALELAPDQEQLLWNAIVIRERGGAAFREAERSSVPWLGYVLAGDWRRAVEELRAIPHRNWLDLERVLRGTSLEGLEPAVAQLVDERAGAALAAAELMPPQRVAPVYLMRGLATWWMGEGMLPTAIELVEAIPGYWRGTTVFDLLWWIGYRGG